MKIKTLKFILTFCIAIILLGCASTVNTTRTNYNFSPTPLSAPIIVYGLTDTIPRNSQQIGTVRIGDSGFSVNCDWEQVLEKAKNACRKMGGNGIQIIDVSEPNFWLSTCYRLYVYTWKIPEKEYIEKLAEKQYIQK